ncbi:MAG: CapA family protein [Desulfuromonadales bacterium]|nr:CapA family protein [Chloroflexota bacterium]MCK4621480.1 CapA family protein [Desulfuromonadales bacterium]
MLSVLKSTAIIIFMVGDVMLGRGIDQILPQPSDPVIYEPYLKDARDYVLLAEQSSGPIPRPVDISYLWGDALGVLQRIEPDLRLINLETAVTTSDTPWPGKGINYRMQPANLGVLSGAGIDACSLANNHVLDWGRAGLKETLTSLKTAGVNCAGAGQQLEQARAPAVFELPPRGRVLLFAYGHPSSGIPPEWAATDKQSGINLLPDFSDTSVQRIAEQVAAVKAANDLVLFSIHWGGNWGYPIPAAFRRFAHRLIDEAGIDIIHGHSSHHVMGIEVYRDRPILYGCGDFINDYEGIGGKEAYRAELGLMYFVSSDPQTGRLLELRMVPTRLKQFRLQRASRKETDWLVETLNREGKQLGTRVVTAGNGDLLLQWD